LASDEDPREIESPKPQNDLKEDLSQAVSIQKEERKEQERDGGRSEGLQGQRKSAELKEEAENEFLRMEEGCEFDFDCFD